MHDGRPVDKKAIEVLQMVNGALPFMLFAIFGMLVRLLNDAAARKVLSILVILARLGSCMLAYFIVYFMLYDKTSDQQMIVISSLTGFMGSEVVRVAEQRFLREIKKRKTDFDNEEDEDKNK